jgi:hypothetical protein
VRGNGYWANPWALDQSDIQGFAAESASTLQAVRVACGILRKGMAEDLVEVSLRRLIGRE